MSEAKYPDTLEMAMLGLQLEIQNPIKTATNPHFKNKYAILPEICDLYRPLMAKYGLYMTHRKDIKDGEDVLVTEIVHAPSGKKMESVSKLHLEKKTPQGVGSSMTYLRRYDGQAMLNVAQEDDDGQAAEKPKVEPITTERKAFIIETIQNAKDVETVKKLNASAKDECIKANDPAAFEIILKAAKERINQLQPPQENTNDTTN